MPREAAVRTIQTMVRRRRPLARELPAAWRRCSIPPRPRLQHHRPPPSRGMPLVPPSLHRQRCQFQRRPVVVWLDLLHLHQAWRPRGEIRVGGCWRRLPLTFLPPRLRTHQPMCRERRRRLRPLREPRRQQWQGPARPQRMGPGLLRASKAISLLSSGGVARAATAAAGRVCRRPWHAAPRRQPLPQDPRR